MAFDGITVSCIKKELRDHLTGGYITKIAQPEKDELQLTIKNNGTSYRVLISANPSLPLIYFTDKNKQGPMSAPAFCMLLRKHLGGGRILDITQPSLERVLVFRIEHRNELGDLCRKKLIIELMGKYSNIIFTDSEDVILDAIRRVSANISSVREVLPGRTWFIPQTQDKEDPYTLTREAFLEKVFAKNAPLSKAIYTTLTGFSPMAGIEICCRAGIAPDAWAPDCEEPVKEHIYHTFSRFMEDLAGGVYQPAIYYEQNRPVEFSAFASEAYAGNEKTEYASISLLLESFYAQKNTQSRIRQKSTDLRKIVSNLLERNVKKLQLQEKQLKDTQKREKFRVYGELLTAYGYSLEPGADKLETVNYYTGEPVTIPLDPTIAPLDNAKKFFEKYNKQKRTFEAVTAQIEETSEDIRHLESIQTSLELAVDEADLTQISEELQEAGYTKKKSGKKRGRQSKAAPLHFISSDGFDLYVGKNNYQNDALTFSTPMNRDWWFHAKQVPGSHVVLKTTLEELPDRAFEEAAQLAAWFSKGRENGKVEVDYTLRKNVKKPAKAKPGFVVYYTNYSMTVPADISNLRQANEM